MSTAPERLAAGLLCVGFDGPAPTEDLRRLIDLGVRSVILFARNGTDAASIATLTRAIRALSADPILVAVDHEGGDVQRFRDGFTGWPPARDVLDAAAARARGATMARELRAVGIGLDFAPVVDVDSNPANPVIGARSFGVDPAHVAGLGAAMIDGLQSNGVAACAKHFPGHGDTDVDSHHDLPVLPHDLERLRTIEFPPFRAAIDAGVASIMTAHVLFPAVDADRPATLSPAVINGLLRRELGYDGVIVSDDLEMDAIAARMPVPEAAVQAIRAGVDLLLCCHTPERQLGVVEALAEAINNGTLARDAVASARARVDALVARYAV